MKLASSVYIPKTPLSLSKNETFKAFTLFRGITGGLLEISCHISAIAKDHIPHDLHDHDEEEIVLLLSGSANLIHQNSNDLAENGNIDLKEGQFVYYPAHFPHTLKTTSDIPVKILALKWKTNLKNKRSGLNFSYFNIPDNLDNQKNKKFLIKTLFEGPTLYLQKLHCHTSVINPGGRFKTHRDIYDVITIILEGEVETLGKKAKPHDVIFYAIGKPHGIHNRGDDIAREVVFEFHRDKVSLVIKIPYLLDHYFRKLIRLRFLKKRLKKILRYYSKEKI